MRTAAKPLISRAIVIVMDGVGAGELPDAARFGDEGSNTLANIARAVGGLRMPHLGRLGLGNIIPIEGVPPEGEPLASFGKMGESGPAKDTTLGHWELMGLLVEKPFPVYPHGFPPGIIEAVEEAAGRRIIGNIPASGTGIIDRYGEEHLRTGALIVYTSADSVFQIAAHEAVIPLEELYRICREARRVLRGEHGVGRVIARPFTGDPGHFLRTPRRRDFSLPPPGPTLLDHAAAAGVPAWGVGKIDDIFIGRGLSRAVHTTSNMEGFDVTLGLMRELTRGLILTNLVDFDTHWGHRNDPQGFARTLEEADRRVPDLLGGLREGDVLVFTADHGCDPTTPSTDHSREYVPLLVTGPKLKKSVDLGTRSTFADLAATLAELMDIRGAVSGSSFAGCRR